MLKRAKRCLNFIGSVFVSRGGTKTPKSQEKSGRKSNEIPTKRICPRNTLGKEKKQDDVNKNDDFEDFEVVCLVWAVLSDEQMRKRWPFFY